MKRAWALSIVVIIGAKSVWAAEPKGIESRRGSFRPELIAKFLERGEIALVESDEKGEQKQILILSQIGAPPEVVYDAILDVDSYPKFLKTMAEAKVVERKDGFIAYRWKFDIPVLDLKGTRWMRGRRPSLVDVRGHSGNFSASLDRWELFPLDGGKRTLAALYRTLDFETAGLVLQAMVKIEPNMKSAMGLAMSYIHIRSLRRHLEGRPEIQPDRSTGPVPKFQPVSFGSSALDLSELRRLLAFGQVSMIESNADGSLKQVILFTLVRSTLKTIAGVVGDPAKFPEFIPNWIEQEVTSIGDHKMRLEYEIDATLTSVDGISEMSIEPDGSVELLAISGDISRGRWRWEFLSLEENETLLKHYAYSDVGEISWFVKQIVSKQPLAEHGIVLSSASIGISAMKARAEGRR